VENRFVKVGRTRRRAAGGGRQNMGRANGRGGPVRKDPKPPSWYSSTIPDV